jgi:hypothetical protein
MSPRPARKAVKHEPRRIKPRPPQHRNQIRERLAAVNHDRQYSPRFPMALLNERQLLPSTARCVSRAGSA